ncbi:3-keto-disaccharide hydrolase [Paludisphaera borealis]|uniref:3-keto-alpha-glucoside-1,2-lyase/3-keto-2-hydroxy-glucal hydratase domain-containing protein n=1 Tax=Paludisphaera borealis TaxID=1387353 RepID=A0A1U7CMI7_9BACT|nr:DUF1080 domain-containing protein [Paludisphaera borealis]APW60150.1 putative beta-jelly-roll-type glycoside hydrolase of unknown function [Paludisphaera borealis]
MKPYQWARVGLWSLVVTGLTACGAQAEEWVSLFDGKTLSGWTKGGGNDGSHWEVKDGSIVGTGSASMLYSPKTYKNFKYRAEVKINDHGNSGLYFRCPAPNGSFSEGYEAQIDSTHSDPIRTGSIYGFVHVYKQLVPADEWFTYELEVVDKDWRGMVIPHITVKINGEILFVYLDRTKAWKEGHFAFQQHDPGSRVEIRKIEVVELP